MSKKYKAFILLEIYSEFMTEVMDYPTKNGLWNSLMELTDEDLESKMLEDAEAIAEVFPDRIVDIAKSLDWDLDELGIEVLEIEEQSSQPFELIMKTYLPFSLLVSGVPSSTKQEGITLNDTTDTPVEVNYIKVSRCGSDLLTARSKGFWGVVPEGLYTSSNDVSMTAVSGGPLAAGASLVSIDEKELEILLPAPLTTSSISIINDTGFTDDFVVTYGILEGDVSRKLPSKRRGE